MTDRVMTLVREYARQTELALSHLEHPEIRHARQLQCTICNSDMAATTTG